jgi:hypothetical protein
MGARGASVVDSGSSSVFAAVSVAVVVSGVDSMAVSILGASSETLVAFPLSGDFERPNALN